jgi:hypothetical protein
MKDALLCRNPPLPCEIRAGVRGAAGRRWGSSIKSCSWCSGDPYWGPATQLQRAAALLWVGTLSDEQNQRLTAGLCDRCVPSVPL